MHNIHHLLVSLVAKVEEIPANLHIVKHASLIFALYSGVPIYIKWNSGRHL